VVSHELLELPVQLIVVGYPVFAYRRGRQTLQGYKVEQWNGAGGIGGY